MTPALIFAAILATSIAVITREVARNRGLILTALFPGAPPRANAGPSPVGESPAPDAIGPGAAQTEVER